MPQPPLETRLDYLPGAPPSGGLPLRRAVGRTWGAATAMTHLELISYNAGWSNHHPTPSCGGTLLGCAPGRGPAATSYRHLVGGKGRTRRAPYSLSEDRFRRAGHTHTLEFLQRRFSTRPLPTTLRRKPHYVILTSRLGCIFSSQPRNPIID